MKIVLKISAVVLALAMMLTVIAAFSAETVTGKRGDADGDGYVSIMDATRIQRYLVGYHQEDADWIEVFGDVDGDGEAGILDVTAIQRWLAGFDNIYGIDEEIAGVLPDPTEAPTQAPTEAPTDAPTEAPTQAPTSARDPYELPPV